MTFEQFNIAEVEAASAPLLTCCGSKTWAEEVLARRPFQSREALLAAAETVWWRLDPSDWLEAFSAHPKIGASKNGDKSMSKWSSQEQSGMDHATLETLDRLAQENQEYERRFGWIFLVNATGKSAPEMLHLLQSRMKNERAGELRIAAGEQAKIMRLRLNKLLDE